MFDYYSLPVEVKSLIDSYEHKGKAERKELIVKHKKYTSDEDDDDDLMKEEDDEDEDEEETVDYSDLITGNCTSSQKDRRDIGKYHLDLIMYVIFNVFCSRSDCHQIG